MSELDDLKTSFTRKLDSQIEQHAKRFETELQALREQILHQARPALPEDIVQRLSNAGTGLIRHSQPASLPIQTLVDIGETSALRDLDAAFASLFRLADYFSTYRLSYPTKYCETLAEFYSFLTADLDLSPQARQAEVERLAAEAEETARQTEGGGVFGVNLPGQGCYLNGWLFVYGRDIPPTEAFRVPKLLERILSTAAHEKLGHGFLSEYSALGAVKTRLGLDRLDLARKFSLRTADDPISSLRRDQAQLVFMISQLVEEGWATWIETFLARALSPDSTEAQHPRHSLEAVVQAVKSIPNEYPDRDAVRESLLTALAILFGKEDLPLPVLLQAVMIVEVLGMGLDDHFSQRLHQPLRYAVGELLFTQVEANQGALCVPYTALIATNVTFDLSQISLADLGSLMSRDPRLQPDARLAALSRLRLKQPNSVEELAQRAESELSFSVPPEIKG